MKGTVKVSNSSGAEIFYNAGDSVWEQVDGYIEKPFHIPTTPIEDMPSSLQEKTMKIKGVKKRTIKEQFGPAGSYKNAGLGIAVFRSKYIMRGGDDQDPGIFGFATNHGPDPEDNADDVGFRCACAWSECKSSK